MLERWEQKPCVDWPAKASADAAWETMQNDPAMGDLDIPFDGRRMIRLGFDFES
ncbi:MAG: DUF1428 family protein [Xanthomonadales bacterium]|nr:DUF1428 family protein [Xanthomonadales bacterium]